MACKTRRVHKQNYPSNKFPCRAFWDVCWASVWNAEISLFFSFHILPISTCNVQCYMLCRHAKGYRCVANATKCRGYWLQQLTAYFIARSINAFHFLVVSTTKGIILFHVMLFPLSFCSATEMELIYTPCHDFNSRRLNEKWKESKELETISKLFYHFLICNAHTIRQQ